MLDIKNLFIYSLHHSDKVSGQLLLKTLFWAIVGPLKGGFRVLEFYYFYVSKLNYTRVLQMISETYSYMFSINLVAILGHYCLKHYFGLFWDTVIGVLVS